MARRRLVLLAFCAAFAPWPTPAAIVDTGATRLHRPVTGLNGNQDGFAQTLVRVGDVALVGAPGDRYDNSDSTGSLYAWRREGEDWSLTGVLSPVGADLCNLPGLLVGTDTHAFAIAGTGDCSGFAGTALVRIDVDTAGVPTLGDATTLVLDGEAVMASDLDADAGTVVVAGWPYPNSVEIRILVHGTDLRQPAQYLEPPTAATPLAGQVAVSGEWLAASCYVPDGLNTPTGCVHLFQRSVSGAWQHALQLDAPAQVHRPTFGSDLRFAGERLFVGVHSYDGSTPRAGSVVEYVFEDGQWQQSAVIAPENGLPGDQFGRRLDVDRGELFVYAPERRAGPGYRREGALYRYCDVDGTWQPCGFREAPAGDEDWPRPEDVAVFEDEILFAQPYFFNLADGSQGTVARVTRDAALTQTGHFHPGDGGTDWDAYGAAVATGGDLLAVGAPGYHGHGGVFIYRRVGAAWQLEATFVGDYIGPNCPGFGSAVAVRGNSVAVTNGCPDEANDAQGYIHFHSKGEDGWSASAHRIPMTDENLGFGRSLLVVDGAVIYGAPQARVDGIYNAGAVHVLRYFSLGLIDNVVHSPARYENMQFGFRIAAHAAQDSGLYASDIVLAASGRGVPASVSLFHVAGTAFDDAKLLATLSSTEPDPDAAFGDALAVDSDAVYIGAPTARCPVGGYHRTGALYRYARIDGAWAMTDRDCAMGQTRFAADIASNGRSLITSSLGSAGVRLHEYAIDAGRFESIAVRDDARPGGYGSPLALSTSTLAVGAPDAPHPTTFTHTGAVDVYDTGHVFTDDFESGTP